MRSRCQAFIVIAVSMSTIGGHRRFKYRFFVLAPIGCRNSGCAIKGIFAGSQSSRCAQGNTLPRAGNAICKLGLFRRANSLIMDQGPGVTDGDLDRSPDVSIED